MFCRSATSRSRTSSSSIRKTGTTRTTAERRQRRRSHALPNKHLTERKKKREFSIMNQSNRHNRAYTGIRPINTDQCEATNNSDAIRWKSFFLSSRDIPLSLLLVLLNRNVNWAEFIDIISQHRTFCSCDRVQLLWLSSSWKLMKQLVLYSFLSLSFAVLMSDHFNFTVLFLY